MGLLRSFFGGSGFEGKDGGFQLDWMPLSRLDQLDEIREASEKKLQIIYKHSTTCGISGMTLRRLEGSLEGLQGEADLYFLDLHRDREVSNAVAKEFGIPHESPQVLVIRNEEVISTASHGSILSLDFDAFS